jgi:glycosyltransferase involved in cell wall biosynthesis
MAIDCYIRSMANLVTSTLVVMPAFNEEAAIGDVIAEVFQALPGVRCLVVDDGSNDHTSLVAKKAGAIVATLPYNLGVGGAMRVGFTYALAEGFANVVQVDADGQHDPQSIQQLIDQLDTADLVLGARFAGEGEYVAKGPRRWAMVVLAGLLSRSAGTRLTDTTSGFRASGPRAVRLFAEHYPAEYLGDTLESLVIAARAGCVIRQVPVSMRPRAGGTPSHRPVKAAVFLLRVGVAMLFAFLRPPVATHLMES